VNTGPKAVLIGNLSMLRSFTGKPVETIVANHFRGDVTRYSRYCKNWRKLTVEGEDAGGGLDEEKVLAELIDIARRETVPPVLFYGDDVMLKLISKNRERLLEYYRFNMPGRELVEACMSKKDFAALAGEKKLPVPSGLQSSPELDCEMIEKKVGFPCALKPGTHIGWFSSEAVLAEGNMLQKILLVNDLDECATALENMRKFTTDFIVQEYIPGGEDQIYSFHAYIPRSGMERTAYVGKKIRTYPSMGGESSYVELVREPAIIQLGFEIVDKLAITGPVKIDFKKDINRNKFFVLEINLRFNLWNYLGSRCGINLPYMAYMDICGLEYTPSMEYQTGLRWLNFGMDLRSFVKDYYPSGQLSLPAWIRSFWHPKIYAYFCWSDPLPFIVRSARDIGRLPKKVTAGM
jgi:predicted ATP-grasp superfamily ATP-dependent carboligase